MKPRLRTQNSSQHSINIAQLALKTPCRKRFSEEHQEDGQLFLDESADQTSGERSRDAPGGGLRNQRMEAT